MNGNYIVLYDIADNKRLARAASIVLDYGIRIQRSLYEVTLTPHSLKVLCNRLATVIDQEEDGIKIFPLCESCLARRVACGPNQSIHDDSEPWLIL